MSAAVGRLPKPKLRRLLMDRLKFHVPMAIGLAFLTQVTLKKFYHDVRRDKIRDFYKTYDVEKEAARFRRLGLQGFD